MTTVERPQAAVAPQVPIAPPRSMSVDEYLAAELASPVKHEYVGGAVYMMSGARNTHNRIATNTLVAHGSRLEGKRFEVFNSDTKIRIRLPTQVRFYYPDVSVVGRSGPGAESFQDEPILIIEVLSHSTHRLDLGEKKDAYLMIPSLAVYLLIQQESATVTAFRRTEQGFVREVHQGIETVVPLPEIETELPLSKIYRAVEFVSEPADEEGR